MLVKLSSYLSPDAVGQNEQHQNHDKEEKILDHLENHDDFGSHLSREFEKVHGSNHIEHKAHDVEHVSNI